MAKSHKPLLIFGMWLICTMSVDSAQLGDTFGTGLSQVHISNEEMIIFESGKRESASLTHFWITGDHGMDQALVRYYVDGEATPSIEFYPAYACGQGFGDPKAPWGNTAFGRGAKTGGWYHNFVVPFQSTIKVTLSYPGATSTLIAWVIIRGTERYPLNIERLSIPQNAKLILQKIEGKVFQPLDYVPIAELKSGTGVLYQHSLFVESTTMNFLEGCHRLWTSNSTSEEDMILASTGTEDYFDSSFYFSSGLYTFPNAGLTHLNRTAVTFSGYRFHDTDPIAFSGGLKFLWRVGDTWDPTTGLKCVGTSPVHQPKNSTITSYAWMYVWEDEKNEPVMNTIGTAISQMYVDRSERTIYTHTLKEGVMSAAMTHYWCTGYMGMDVPNTVIRYYVDGETVPGIEFTNSLAVGVGFDDNTAPWGTNLIGKAADGSVYWNMLVPFQKSVKITVECPTCNISGDGDLGYSGPRGYFIVRGVENLPLIVDSVKLPASARLKLHKLEDHLVQSMAYVPLVTLKDGSGFLFQSTLSIRSGDENCLEGCYRAYTSSSMSYPGVLLATGTEDYFVSADYFNGGKFRLPVSGLTHKETDSQKNVNISAYRFHHSDPVAFHKGFTFMWRNGDTVDEKTGLKCTKQYGGIPVGIPTESFITSYAWLYRWDDSEDLDLNIFGTGYSGMFFTVEEQTLFDKTLDAGSFAMMSFFWATGYNGLDNIIVRYYVDGEENASIEFQIAMGCGVGFGEQFAPWGTLKMGKGAKTGAWYNSFQIPFEKSIRVTVQAPSEEGFGYICIRGVENLPLKIGNLELPTSTRLVLKKIESMEVEPLDYVPLASLDSESGLIYLTTLAVQSETMNFLEGCVRVYTSHDMEFPGLLVGTGTEDYFDSAFYFDAGRYALPNAGLTHLNTTSNNGATTFSAYRFHDTDPVVFKDGMSLIWRNGDAWDPITGLKCILKTGGNVIGTPTKSIISSYVWMYLTPPEWTSSHHNTLMKVVPE